MAGLTTHVLDTANGCPGNEVALKLFVVEGDKLTLVKEAVTNSDGRVDSPLLSEESIAAGTYELHFEAGEYFRGKGVRLPEPAFLDTVVIRFGVADTAAHYHVPLSISPYAYSTYRGS